MYSKFIGLKQHLLQQKQQETVVQRKSYSFQYVSKIACSMGFDWLCLSNIADLDYFFSEC